MALLIIALADKAGRPIGVTDIDQQLGGLKSGTASKLLRTMMHIEAEKKADVANTVYAERDPKDLRRWDLHLTPKGISAARAIARAMEGEQ
ncbi:hypothetical protein [Altererythrobacter fulvus]|uniref:hypothetical protein n=1 Tax=Caenibius fulvus TaxID=2126012 RepID=UPI003018BC1F